MTGPAESGVPLRKGWSARGLRVPREGPEGEEDAGVFGVSLVMPQDVASDAARHGIGAWVAVVGMLTVDVDYSDVAPRFHYAVVVRSIEAAPEPEAVR